MNLTKTAETTSQNLFKRATDNATESIMQVSPGLGSMQARLYALRALKAGAGDLRTQYALELTDKRALAAQALLSVGTLALDAAMLTAVAVAGGRKTRIIAAVGVLAHAGVVALGRRHRTAMTAKLTRDLDAAQ